MNKAALLDIIAGLKRYDLWSFLGWHDVRQRYRRSTLGPFWITIASAVMVGFMAVVYSGLMRQPLAQYLPLVGTGIVLWGFISGALSEGSNVFITASSTIKQVPAPLSVHLFRLLWQQFIFFLHNIVVIIAVLALGSVTPSFVMLLAFPAFALVIVNVSWMMLLLGSLGARYRDVPVIVQTFMSALFLVTPIVWELHSLPVDRRWVAYINPFWYLIDVVRLPLLGSAPSGWVWGVCFGMAGLGWAATLYVYDSARRRLAYWI